MASMRPPTIPPIIAGRWLLEVVSAEGAELGDIVNTTGLSVTVWNNGDADSGRDPVDLVAETELQPDESETVLEGLLRRKVEL